MNTENSRPVTLKITLISLLLGVTGLLNANAAPSISSPPADLPAYQTSIQSSLVNISCTGYTAVGIVEKVGTGVSSRIVAASNAIANCPKVRNGSGFQFTNLLSNKSFGGNLVQVGNGLTAEYAWLAGNTESTPRFLNDRQGPIPGGWVSIAGPASGSISVNWFASSILSIDLSTSTLVITNAGMNIPVGGLVFDKRGNFLGLVSSSNLAYSPTLAVAGSPLRCKNIDETKIYSEVCLTNENKSILRQTLWPDNSIVSNRISNSKTNIAPTPTTSGDPFGRVKNPDERKHAIPQVSPTPKSPVPTSSTKPSPAPSTKPTAVTCTKGKEVIPATGIPPTCPAGYKKK